MGDFVGSGARARAAARLRQEPFGAGDFMRRDAREDAVKAVKASLFLASSAAGRLDTI